MRCARSGWRRRRKSMSSSSRAHPLEARCGRALRAAGRLYRRDGVLPQGAQSAADKPVYEVELRPRTGFIRCPTWRGRPTADAWEEECAAPGAPGRAGAAGLLPRRLAQLRGDRPPLDRRQGHRQHDLFAGRRRFLSRCCRPAAITKGLPAELRTDVGEGDIRPRRAARISFPTSRAISLGAAAPRARARHEHGATGPVERQI